MRDIRSYQAQLRRMGEGEGEQDYTKERSELQRTYIHIAARISFGRFRLDTIEKYDECLARRRESIEKKQTILAMCEEMNDRRQEEEGVDDPGACREVMGWFKIEPSYTEQYTGGGDGYMKSNTFSYMSGGGFLYPKEITTFSALATWARGYFAEQLDLLKALSREVLDESWEEKEV